MRRFIFLVIMVVACVAGCKKEYVPHEESIPIIPPSTRGIGSTNESKKADADGKVTAGKKSGAIAP